jgi:exonuclease VII small subunit
MKNEKYQNAVSTVEEVVMKMQDENVVKAFEQMLRSHRATEDAWAVCRVKMQDYEKKLRELSGL